MEKAAEIQQPSPSITMRMRMNRNAPKRGPVSLYWEWLLNYIQHACGMNTVQVCLNATLSWSWPNTSGMLPGSCYSIMLHPTTSESCLPRFCSLAVSVDSLTHSKAFICYLASVADLTVISELWTMNFVNPYSDCYSFVLLFHISHYHITVWITCTWDFWYKVGMSQGQLHFPPMLY